MNWIGFGILAGLFFAIYNAFLKQSSSNLHALIGSLTLSIGSALFTLGIIVTLRFTGQEFTTTQSGIKLAFIAGLFSALGGLCYFIMYQKKAPLNLGLPLLSVSTIIFSIIIGLFFFGEKLTVLKIGGLILAAVSIFILSL